MRIEQLINELWSGEMSVGVFVHSGTFYWMIDHAYNFTLDAERDYRAYLKKGDITAEQYDSACKAFRQGFLTLTKENFRDYLLAAGESLVSRGVLEKLLYTAAHTEIGDLVMAAERHFVTGEPLGNDTFRIANEAASTLPLFYVNFDRKIFMHMDVDRSHEDLAHTDWFAKFGDFSFLIPDSERYWTSKGDAWKLRFV